MGGRLPNLADDFLALTAHSFRFPAPNKKSTVFLNRRHLGFRASFTGSMAASISELSYLPSVSGGGGNGNDLGASVRSRI